MSELADAGIPVTVTCRVPKVSRQPYYRWLTNPITPSEVVEAYRANALFDAHRDDPEFGHRLLADEAADAGIHPPRAVSIMLTPVTPATTSDDVIAHAPR